MVILDIPLRTMHSSLNDSQPPLFDDKSRGSGSLNGSKDGGGNGVNENEGGGGTSRDDMYLSKPRSAIYSVDINPRSDRYATGGGDSKVKIWTYTTLFRATKNGGKDYMGAWDSEGYKSVEDKGGDGGGEAGKQGDGGGTDGLLFVGSHHTGSVMCVKWTNSGRYLASASDDSLIFLYHLLPKSSSSVLSSISDSNVENWQRFKILRHHSLDVVDLTWSPDDVYLVSCSLDKDSPLCVWKPMESPALAGARGGVVGVSPCKVFDVSEAHSSNVKGVVFDPLGKYICSSADDPSLAIWQTGGDWDLEHVFKGNCEIFNSMVSDLTGETIFRRVDWASDGGAILCTNASVKSKKIASIIQRNTWATAGDGGYQLFGHRSTVVVGRCVALTLAHI